MNELQGYIAAALNGLMIGKYKGGTELTDDAIRWYASYAVKLGKATQEANTPPKAPPVTPDKPTPQPKELKENGRTVG